jgi:hypothetical protein
MDKCIGLFGWMFGHKFKHLFNVEIGTPTLSASWFESRLLFIQSDLEALALSRPRKEIYIHSACKRCGKTIRENPNEN